MTLKQCLIGTTLLVCAFSVGRFSAPKRVEIKEVERVVTRESEVKDRNQNVVETSKETRLPDGTIIVERRKEKETSTQTESERHSETQTDRSTKIELRPSFRVGVLYEPAIKSFQEVSYSLILEKRLFSELYAGASFSSRRTLGITLSLGF